MGAQRLQKAFHETKGQSSLEFALVLILVLGFFFFFIQASFCFSFGNWVHYATFMSARAYLSAGPDNQDQIDRSTQVLSRMLKKSGGGSVDRFPFFGKGLSTGTSASLVVGMEIDSPLYQQDDRAFSWLRGIRYTFQSRLFLLPLSGKRGGSTNTPLKMTSESWLGKEPSTQECLQDLATRGGGLFDNGC